MKNLVVRFGRMLADLLTSKKVGTAVLTAVAAYATKDPTTQKYIVETGIVLLAGQGAADWGKEAKKVEKR